MRVFTILLLISNLLRVNILFPCLCINKHGIYSYLISCVLKNCTFITQCSKPIKVNPCSKRSSLIYCFMEINALINNNKLEVSPLCSGHNS